MNKIYKKLYPNNPPLDMYNTVQSVFTTFQLVFWQDTSPLFSFLNNGHVLIIVQLVAVSIVASSKSEVLQIGLLMFISINFKT